MSDLADFLLARISEDEAMAQEAIGKPVEISGAEVVAHISRWTSRRVLAECAAKRRIVEMHHDGGAFGWCAECDGHPPCDTLRALASAYADHSDYRDEWSA